MDVPWVGVLTIVIGFLIWREMKKQEITRWVAAFDYIVGKLSVGSALIAGPAGDYHFEAIESALPVYLATLKFIEE